MTRLDELLSDHQGGHSELQLDAFITVNSGGTLYGCYKQALRELWKRWRGLRGLRCDRELLLNEIDRTINLSCTAESNFWSYRRAQLRVDRRRLRLDELDRSIADTEREFLRFYEQAAALKSAIGELTPERRAQLDRDMWAHNLKVRAAIDLLTTGRVAAATVRLLRSLPAALRQPLLADVFHPAGPRRLIDWALSDQSLLPEPITLTPEESERLLDSTRA